MSTASLAANSLSEEEKVLLHVTMQQSIAEHVSDGKYLYFDRKAASVETLYPVKSHPMILQMGEHFILCTDFRDSDGKSVNVDFYIARRDAGFVVFDKVIDNREPIKRMMKAGLAKMLK